MVKAADAADILVIGGGPSGLIAAREAALQGVNALVFEEHSRIGEPEHCAGLLGIKGLKGIDMWDLPDHVIQNPRIFGARIYSPKGQELIVRKKEPHAIVADRSAFDKELAARAEEAGVRIRLQSRVRECQADAKQIAVSFQHKGGRPDQCKGRVLIAADGKWGLTSQHLGLPYHRRPRSFVFAAQRFMRGVQDLDEDLVEVYQTSEFAKDYFAWVIPMGDGCAKVGLASKTVGAPNVLDRFMKRHPVIAPRLRSAECFKKTAGTIPCRGPVKRSYADGVIVVGDAVGQTKPTTGGGVIIGGLAARIGGRVAAEAVQLGDTRAKRLRRYEKLWRKQLGSNLRVMGLVRRYLNCLSDNHVEQLFHKLHDRRSVIEEFGDVDNQRKLVVKLLLTPGLYPFYLRTSIGFLASYFKD